MAKKIDIVLVYYNKSNQLVETLKIFQERNHDDVRFYLIDNGSTKREGERAKDILTSEIKHFKYIKREDTGRDAGGFWHYILNLYKQNDIDMVLFGHIEFHQRGMHPINVSERNDTKDLPFYPDYHGLDGVSLYKCRDWLGKHCDDCIGFGGRRFRENIDFDPRWKTYWNERWHNLKLEWYDFFSGACFCVHSDMIKHYIEIGKPNSNDISNQYFPWMWERMWGTIPAYAGGKLIHYNDWSWNRIEEYHPRPEVQLNYNTYPISEFAMSISRFHNEDLSVTKIL